MVYSPCSQTLNFPKMMMVNHIIEKQLVAGRMALNNLGMLIVTVELLAEPLVNHKFELQEPRQYQ